MKAIIVLLLLLISGCSWFGGSRTSFPEVQPIKVVTVEQAAPMYHPPLPNAVTFLPVEWKILTPETMEEYLKDLEEGNAPANAWHSITSKSYENLTNNISDIKRYIRQTLSIVKYYRKLDDKKQEEQEKE